MARPPYVIFLSHMERRSDHDIWRGLANPIRRSILDLLSKGPLTTGELTRRFPELSRYAVMQHLGVLEESGLVLTRKEGRERFNYINAVPLQRIYERWVGPIAARAARTSLALKRHLEQGGERWKER